MLEQRGRTRPTSTVLDRRSDVSKATCKMRISPSQDTIRYHPLDTQIAYHNISVQSRHLQIGGVLTGLAESARRTTPHSHHRRLTRLQGKRRLCLLRISGYFADIIQRWFPGKQREEAISKTDACWSAYISRDYTLRHTLSCRSRSF